MPYVFKYMNEVRLPDVKFEGGVMTNITFTVHQPESLDDIEFSVNPRSSGFVMRAKNLFA
jgi:hypothetical protein